LRFPGPIEGLGPSSDVALANIYGNYSIILAIPPPKESYIPRILTTISTIVHEDPFPAPGPNGKSRFSMKTYSENAGLLEQLEALGILRRTGISYKQGFVDIPVVEVCLEEYELVHACAAHYEENGAMDCRLEIVGSKYPRCSKCKQVYYCDAECQNQHWEIHKKDCKIARRDTTPGGLLAMMENRRRAGMSSFLSQKGFQTLNI